MSERRVLPWLALLSVQLSFSTLAVVGKMVLTGGVPPLALAGIRVFFAALLLSAIAFARRIRDVPWDDLLRFAGLSLLGVVANMILFIEGLARTTAINAGVLIVTIPIFTFLVAVLFRREHFDRLRAAGVLVAATGTLVLLRAERFDLGDEVILGNVLIVLNSLSYSFYLVLARGVLQRYSSTTVIAFVFLFGALFLLPLGIPSMFSAAAAGIFTPDMVWGIAWIILVPSVLAYGLNAYALKRLHASTVGGFVFLQPIGIVILALVFLPEEHLEVRTVVAGLLIIMGVLVVARSEALRVVPQPASP